MNVQEDDILRHENEESSCSKLAWMPLDVTSLLIKKATSSGDHNFNFQPRHDEIIDWTQTAPPPCIGGGKDDNEDLTQADINLLVTTLSQLNLGGSGSAEFRVIEECKNNIGAKNPACDLYIDPIKCRPREDGMETVNCGQDWTTTGGPVTSAEAANGGMECQQISLPNEWPLKTMLKSEYQTSELGHNEEAVPLSFNGGPSPTSTDEKDRRHIAFRRNEAWNLVPCYVEDGFIRVFGRSLQIWREMLMDLVFSDPYTLQSELQKGGVFGLGVDQKAYSPPHLNNGELEAGAAHCQAAGVDNIHNDSAQAYGGPSSLGKNGLRNRGGTSGQFGQRFGSQGGPYTTTNNGCGMMTGGENSATRSTRSNQGVGNLSCSQENNAHRHQRNRTVFNGVRNTSATATSTTSTATVSQQQQDDYRQTNKSRRSTSEAWGSGGKNGGTPNKGCIIQNMVRPPPSEGRFKQIARGKSTPEYLEYVKVVPREMRIPDVDPVTPRVEGSSWREFQAEVRAWKRSLHRKYEALEAQKRSGNIGF